MNKASKNKSAHTLTYICKKYKLKIKIFNNCITIYDGYKIRGKKLKLQILQELLNTYELIFFEDKRTVKSFLREWQAHNVLYKLGLFKARTRDTDLDNNESRFRRFCYFFLSILPD